MSWSTMAKMWTTASSVITQPPVNISNLFSRIRFMNFDLVTSDAVVHHFDKKYISVQVKVMSL